MQRSAIALGTFDGIHKGHQSVIKNAVLSNLYSVAVTFSTPPKAALCGEKPSLLISREQKSIYLKELGINKQEYIDFDTVRDLKPEAFLDDICEKYNAAVISCGFNYRFGKNAAGDTELLARYCESKGIKLIVSEPVVHGGAVVSSTAIRQMISNGEIERANELLYKPFGFTSAVIHGDERGRTIGFPTINQAYPTNLVTAKFGVYASDVLIGDKCYKGITNIGIRPTYRVAAPLSETYIVNFSGSLYGTSPHITLKRFFRGETQFSGIDELKQAITADVKRLKEEIQC